MRVTRSRSGYTLLEVLLAAGIAVLLLGGLYSALELTIRVQNESRLATERATLVRAVLNKFAADVRPSLAPIPGVDAEVSVLPEFDDELGGDAGAGGEGLPLTPSSYGAGVVGDVASLTVFKVRVPDTGGLLVPRSQSPVTDESFGGDVWQVTYWLSPVGGLARSERRYLTDAVLGPPADDEDGSIIAPEVVGVRFEYFDGLAWLEAWDGSMPGPDGKTPQGPPMALAVTLEFQLIGPSGPQISTVRHVIAPAAALGIPLESALGGF